MIAAICVVAAATADAQTQPTDPSPLSRLSVEELSRIDVSTASRHTEAITDAAAAIAVITRDDIRRAGVQTLPEALRLATGAAAARLSAGMWAISARGFNSVTANKVAVLLDGRSVYTPLFSGVFWDAQDVVLDDVERIEVLRGPGGTLWGANAMNGVINIITRSARETLGTLVRVDAGSATTQAVVRYGARFGADGAYRVYSKVRRARSGVLEDGTDARDDQTFTQAGVRLEQGYSGRTLFTLQGDIYTGRFSRYETDTNDAVGGNAIARVQHTFDSGAQLQVQGYYDGTDRESPDLFRERRDTFDAEVQYRRPVLRGHDLLIGGGYQLTRDSTEGSDALSFDPVTRSAPLWNAYVQDSIAIVPGLFSAIVGAKLDHNDYSQTEIQPTVRLRWSLAPGDLVWGAVSRAVRTPTRFDSDLRLFEGGRLVLSGSPTFRPERVVAYEVGYRSDVDFTLSFDVSAFLNEYSRLRTREPIGDAGSLVFDNNNSARTAGIEASARFIVMPGWQLQAGYTRQELEFTLDPVSLDPEQGRAEHNDPRNQFWFRSYADLPGRTELDAVFRFVGELPVPYVPRYGELTLQFIAFRGGSPELSVVGDNLLHDRHVEFGGAAPRTAVRRSVFGRATWRF